MRINFSKLFLAVSLVAGLAFTSCKPPVVTADDPTISGVTPTEVAIGDVITISGTNLDLVTEVGFGAEPYVKVAKAQFTSVSATEIKVAVPAITFPASVAVFGNDKTIVWGGTLTEKGEEPQAPPTATTTAAGTLTGGVIAVFAPSHTPGTEITFEVSTDLTNVENDAITVLCGENEVELGSWASTFGADDKGIVTNFPTEVELGKNYKFTVKINGELVGTAVVKADLVIFGFAKSTLGWNGGIGSGSYHNVDCVTKADAPSTDYYLSFDVAAMPASSGAWAIFIIENQYVTFPNALMTNQDAIGARVRIGAGCGDDICLRFNISAGGKDYGYDFAIGDLTATRGEWVDVVFPLDNFFWWNDQAGANEVLTENVPDFKGAEITKWGVANNIAPWDARGGIGEGQPLVFDIDNIRLIKQ
ncbi:MAG: IPT/TIG domain-containing protein [Prevotellaceae bacterium]|jgi:hypothetical protein|nr:IPT/TIG domain-containing protein [Prevotellaceae bacterium]